MACTAINGPSSVFPYHLEEKRLSSLLWAFPLLGHCAEFETFWSDTVPIHIKRAFLTVLAGLCLLALAACNVTPVDARQDGTRSLSAEEYSERFSGNSIFYAIREGGPNNLEAYFAADGTFKAVLLDQEVISYGTWRVNGSHILIESRDYGFRDGLVGAGPVTRQSMYVYVYPNGTASVFTRGPEGTLTAVQPKPTPGFQRSARWTQIDQKVQANL